MASESVDEFDLVLDKLYIKINKDKTIFMSKKLTYCGHVINLQGLTKTQEYIQAVLKAPQPTNIKQLKSFLGTVNYYNKFILCKKHLIIYIHCIDY